MTDDQLLWSPVAQRAKLERLLCLPSLLKTDALLAAQHGVPEGQALVQVLRLQPHQTSAALCHAHLVLLPLQSVQQQ